MWKKYYTRPLKTLKLDIIIGEGPAARSIRIDLSPFTLAAATTRSGLIAGPLRDRFGIPLRLNFYDIDDLKLIVKRAAHLLQCPIEEQGALEIAKRSRGTPRIAGRLLRRVYDFATVAGYNTINLEVACSALNRLKVDNMGLDPMDRNYLNHIAEHYNGGPVGLDTMAAALSEPKDVLEDVIEPYLIQQGFINRTPRGRMLTNSAYKHIGKSQLL